MKDLSKHDIDFLIDCLKEGKEIPEVYKYAIFPTKQKEYELAYAGKARKEDILADNDEAKAVPLQIEKIFNGTKYPLAAKDWHNLLVFGDNLQILKTFYKNSDPLIKGKVKGKVKLIYIDPPFGTGDEYEGSGNASAYSAKKKGAEFVEFLRRRLIILKEMLHEQGFILVRLDYHFGHYAKAIMDEIFDRNSFRNEFIVNRVKKNVTTKGRRTIPHAVDSIFSYSMSGNADYKDILRKLKETRAGYWHNMESAGFSGPRQVIIDGKTYLPSNNSHFKFTQKQADTMIAAGEIQVNPRTNKPEYWVKEKDYESLDSNWTDIPGYTFTTGYPTENSEVLLERIINLTTEKNDLVMDVFAGSGTTLAVAEKLGRRWIGCDIGKLAIYTTQKRLLEIENSRDPSNPKKKYAKISNSFGVVTSGLYDLGKVFALKKDEYISFVKRLFEVEDTRIQNIGGVPVDGKRREFYVKIFPYWNATKASVDEKYVQELHRQIGAKIGARLYIIAPANNVHFISDYHEIGGTRYYFLKVPYQIIKELHKVQFKKLRQPQSKKQVNDLDEAIGFHFIRQPEVKSELKITTGKVSLKLKKFESAYAQDETGEKLKNFESLAMVLADLNYDGDHFLMDKYFFAQDVLSKKHKGEDEDLDDDEIRKELQKRKEVSIDFERKECGKQIMAIYVDIYGNEFREIFKVK